MSTKEGILIFTDSLVMKEAFCFIEGSGVGNLQVECISDIHYGTLWQLQNFFFDKLLFRGDDSHSTSDFSLHQKSWELSPVENILILQDTRESAELFREESIWQSPLNYVTVSQWPGPWQRLLMTRIREQQCSPVQFFNESIHYNFLERGFTHRCSKFQHWVE